MEQLFQDDIDDEEEDEQEMLENLFITELCKDNSDADNTHNINYGDVLTPM